MAENAPTFEPKPFGRYVLLNKLAVGGMAEIYKAKTYGVDGFEKVLAVKRILPHCSADREFINMLVDEAKLTVLLSHANIVQVYDLGKVGDDYFISMEYIYGTNLREFMNRFIEKKERIPEETSVYIISEMCKGLDYAHRKTDNQGKPLNIVHRDISPQNLLISYEGEVKIVDFGIAKAAMNVSHTMAGILKGKVAYMSPEQALGKPIDHRTDIFSAGLVLYEMLTGEKLFSGETQFEVLNQIRTTRVNTLMLPDTIANPLKAIIAKALAYNPKDRYQNAGDFQLDLTKFLYSSYVDFSPRNLSALMQQVFQSEMKKKETSVVIDEKTNSAIINQSKMENIMVHNEYNTERGQTPNTSTEIKIHESTMVKKFENTAPSFATSSRKEKKSSKIILTLGILMVLGTAGYFSYKFLNKKSHTTPIVTPQLPPTEPQLNIELGSIVVATNPPGAKVYLNGSDTGLETPATLGKLNVGDEYQVRVVKAGFLDFTKSVALTSTQPFKLTSDLIPEAAPLPPTQPTQPIFPVTAFSTMKIDSNPQGARIFLDGVDMQQVTPANIGNLEVGRRYALKLTLPNYFEWTSAIDVKSAEPMNQQAALVPMVQAPPPLPPTNTIPIFGSLNITSKPSGAKISLNGKPTGKSTPATFNQLEADQKVTVALSKEGYQDWSKVVKVGNNKSLDVSGSLKEIKTEPIEKPTEKPEKPTEKPTPPKQTDPEPESSGSPGSLTINSDPSGADVYVNSELRGQTPFSSSSIPSGNVKLIVMKEGFLREIQTIKLGAGESKNLGTIKLGDLYGVMKIASSPPRATVYVDGDNIGARTPVTVQKVRRDKPHTIKLELDGFKTWEGTANLQTEETKKFDVQLERN